MCASCVKGLLANWRSAWSNGCMLTSRTEGTVPIKYQIADSIRTAIESGELQPGDPLPTVDELSARWRCAPLMAREAIDVLKGEGLVTGGRGKRAVVRKPPKRIRLSSAVTQEQKDLVLRPESERRKRGAIEITSDIPIDDTTSSHTYSIGTADADLAEEFSVPVGTQIQRRIYEMTEREGGHRVAFSVSYIPLAIIESNPDLLDEANEPWPGGHQHQLYTVGIEIDRVVRSVIAIQPTPGDRQKWAMEPGVPLLRVRSRSVDTIGRVVELSDAAYPADRTEITFTDHLERWPADCPKYDASRG